LNKIEPDTTAKTWNDLITLEAEFSDPDAEWVFRGESKQREPKTSLQRVCEEFGIKGADTGTLRMWALVRPPKNADWANPR
jgi:hypothetical protein